MSVEIDITDLAEYSEYKDEKCKTLEIIIQKATEFAEFVVKRIRDSSNESDPFIFMNEQEEVGVWLEEWEIDTLNDSELLVFMTVQIERNEVSAIDIPVGILSVSSTPPIFILLALSLISGTFNQFMLLLVLIPIIFGIIYFWKRRVRHTEERNLDFEMAKSDTSFLEALRKLAAVPESDHVYTKEHRKRLEYLEITLSEVGF